MPNEVKTNDKKIIGLDLDGVIIDHCAQKIKIARDFGVALRPEETPSDVIKKIMPLELVRALQQLLYEDPDVALRSPLMAGAQEALHALEQEGVPYVLISRRKKPELAVRLLEKHGLWPSYFSAQNSFFVNEPEEKNIKAKELGVTHYVDDETKVLAKLGDVKYKFLFDSQSAGSEEGDYIRVVSWPELLRYFL